MMNSRRPAYETTNDGFLTLSNASALNRLPALPRQAVSFFVGGHRDVSATEDTEITEVSK